jgi:CheY-like chemotaxis protein
MLAERQRLESLGQLAGGIAHDFNNLLSAILGAASLLRSDEDDESRVEDLRLIVDAAERASELTTRLLALGKRQTLRIVPADANQMLRQVLALVRRVIRSDIVIEFVEGDGLPAVLADGSQLEQVFMNLCLNARDAMPDGGRLSIETEEVVINEEFVGVHPWARPGRYVLVTVTDTGTGMTDDVLERAFDPFFTTKEEGKGTGLGLAVSRGIVEQHGGLVHGYSEPDVGTTFRVYLPVADQAAEVVATAIEPAMSTGTERILVADDQGFVREIVDRILSRSGYSVSVVEDGSAAVEHVRAHPVDLVILDAVMPGLGGREAYARIRELQPNLPVLFASGYGADELTTRFLADTEAPLLAKPFDPDGLRRIVRRLLDEANPSS